MAASKLRRRALFTAVACLATLGSSAYAQSPAEQLETPPALADLPPAMTVTLEQAKLQALDASPILALARMSTQEKDHARRAVHADYLPKVLGSFVYLHFDSPLGTVFTLRNGAQVPVNLVEQDQTLGSIMGAQPITALLKVRGLERMAQADQQLACYDVEKARRAILNGTEQLYIGLWAAHRVRATASEGMPAIEPLAKSPDPVFRAAYLEAVQGIGQADAQIIELQDQLNTLIGFPCGTPLWLEPLPPLEPVVLHCDHAAELAMVHSPDVCSAMANVEKAAGALQIAKTDCLPDVNVFGGYLNQNGIPAVQNNIGFVGGSASYTLFDAGKRRHVIRQREMTVAMAQAAVRKARDEAAAKGRKAYRTFERSDQAIKAAKSMVAVRKEIVAKKAPPADMIKAGKEYLTAEIDLIKAEIGRRIAYSELLEATGMQ